MHKFRRDVNHRLRVLQLGDKISLCKACRYFGLGRASFYHRQTACRQHGLAGLEKPQDSSEESCTSTPWSQALRMGVVLQLSRPHGAFNRKAHYTMFF